MRLRLQSPERRDVANRGDVPFEIVHRVILASLSTVKERLCRPP